jgi:hypothetical protein
MTPSLLLAALLALSPPARDAPAHTRVLPAQWAETAEQREERYHAITADLAAVLRAPALAATVQEVGGSRRAAALLLAVAHHESGFAPDVDRGPCYRGRDGRSLRCDAGRAACLMQIQAGAEAREKLFRDRRYCFANGLVKIARSLRACSRLAPPLRLAAYASGHCSRGWKASREMTAAAARIEARLTATAPGAQGGGS